MEAVCVSGHGRYPANSQAGTNPAPRDFELLTPGPGLPPGAGELEGEDLWLGITVLSRLTAKAFTSFRLLPFRGQTNINVFGSGGSSG